MGSRLNSEILSRAGGLQIKAAVTDSGYNKNRRRHARHYSGSLVMHRKPLMIVPASRWN
jgi:hypothetical protein